MRKIFTILLLTVAICHSLCGCAASAVATTDDIAINSESNEDEDAMSLYSAVVETVEEPLYDDSVNYMGLMILYAGIGDTDALEAAITARNAKIADRRLDYEQISHEEFLDNYEQYAGFALDIDYMSVMEQSCLDGDISAGQDAELKRNLKIDMLGLGHEKISFNDLFELSKIITAEAGSSWLPMEWKLMVGEVVLNRVASVEFPNSVEEVIHQKGQYSSANTDYFKKLIPFESCVEAASRLLNGERLINNGSVVFQSGAVQGSGIYLKLYDSYYGYTYLCCSSNPKLYE